MHATSQRPVTDVQLWESNSISSMQGKMDDRREREPASLKTPLVINNDAVAETRTNTVVKPCEVLDASSSKTPHLNPYP